MGNVVTTGSSKIISGITTQGAKQSFQQCLKYAAKTLVTQVAVNVVDFALEEAVKTALDEIFSLFKTNFSNFIRTNEEIKNVLIATWLSFEAQRKTKGRELDKNLMHM